jgi:hypothetical protein
MTNESKCLCVHWFPRIEDREQCPLHASKHRPANHDYWNGGNCTWQRDPVWPFQEKDQLVREAYDREEREHRADMLREINREIEWLESFGPQYCREDIDRFGDPDDCSEDDSFIDRLPDYARDYATRERIVRRLEEIRDSYTRQTQGGESK